MCAASSCFLVRPWLVGQVGQVKLLRPTLSLLDTFRYLTTSFPPKQNPSPFHHRHLSPSHASLTSNSYEASSCFITRSHPHHVKYQESVPVHLTRVIYHHEDCSRRRRRALCRFDRCPGPVGHQQPTQLWGMHLQRPHSLD